VLAALRSVRSAVSWVERCWAPVGAWRLVDVAETGCVGLWIFAESLAVHPEGERKAKSKKRSCRSYIGRAFGWEAIAQRDFDEAGMGGSPVHLNVGAQFIQHGLSRRW
jgi:hypothetical protein